MTNETNEVLDLFRQTNALLEGHFVLRSGLHSRQFFQCAILLQHTRIAERVCSMLAAKLRGVEAESVISPALGGLIVGHEVARALNKRHIFAEKEENRLVLRRGFSIGAGERFIVVEDVVTRGGRVNECLEIVRQAGGRAAGVAMLVDRSAGSARFAVPALSLLELSFPTYPADQVPADLARLPVSKPGS